MRWARATLTAALLAGCTPPSPPITTQAVPAGPSNQAVQACLTRANGHPEVYSACMNAAYVAMQPRQPDAAADCLATARGNVDSYRACVAIAYAGAGGSGAAGPRLPRLGGPMPRQPAAPALMPDNRRANIGRFEQITDPALTAWLVCVRTRAAAYAVTSDERAEVIAKAVPIACLAQRTKWIEAVGTFNPLLTENAAFLAMTDHFVADTVLMQVLETRAHATPRPALPHAPPTQAI